MQVNRLEGLNAHLPICRFIDVAQRCGLQVWHSSVRRDRCLITYLHAGIKVGKNPIDPF